METQIWQTFIDIVDGPKLTTLLVLIFANVLLGLVLAAITKEFRLQHVADFLSKTVLPFLAGYFAIGLAATVNEDWEPAVTVVFAFIVATMSAKLYTQLKDLGIPVPQLTIVTGTDNKTDKKE